jgi:hypothetical protein
MCARCGDAAIEASERDGWPAAWWEAPAVAYAAVLGPEGLCTIESLHRGARRTIAELGPELERLGISQLWVHESAFALLAMPPRGGASHALIETTGPYRTGAKTPQLSSYQRWWVPGGHGFSLHIPAYENASAFAGADDAYQLLCHVAHYEHATGGMAPWMGGGTITSDAWIRRTYRTKRRADLCVTQHPEPVLSGAAREARWYWSRPAMPSERAYRYCHALDLNLAYAAVAGSIPLPVGECVHKDLPTFDKRVPGVWLIEPEAWVALDLPAPWADDHRRERGGPYWVTTPTMERCDQLGIWPIEAYVWPEHHAYLRPWYEMVRDARAQLLSVGGPPLSAVKEISRRGVGRLASRNRTKALDVDELYQPYWAWAVIAECRARLHRRLSALPSRPVAIDTDAVYFLSSRATPEVLAKHLGLPFGDGLGQFKPAGTCSGLDAREALGTGHAAIAHLRLLVKS